MDINFKINTKYVNDKFRNAMAHYKLGMDLSLQEIQKNKEFYGLVEKYFDMECGEFLNIVTIELENIRYQINGYLKIRG